MNIFAIILFYKTSIIFEISRKIFKKVFGPYNSGCPLNEFTLEKVLKLYTYYTFVLLLSQIVSQEKSYKKVTNVLLF